MRESNFPGHKAVFPESGCLMKHKRWTLLFCFILLMAVLIPVFEYLRNQAIKPAPVKPSKPLRTHENELLRRANEGGIVDDQDLQELHNFTANRYDCADFRLQSLLRILCHHPDQLTPPARQLAKNILLNFRYWMDEPGNDSMCFWSENHQILFSSAELLAGQLYPDEIFSNSGLTGRQHADKARKRILAWLRHRWQYGFSEWYSNVYYVEDIAPLCNLVDFAQDREIVLKSQIVLDLLLYDMASQSHHGTFVSTSGRLYERHKKSGEWASTRFITEDIFGYDTARQEPAGMSLNFLYVKNYQIPSVLKAIGRDSGPVLVKASHGLDLHELESARLIGQRDEQIMMQWGMEAFTAEPVIANSMTYIQKNGLLTNYYLHGFSSFNFTILKIPYLLQTLSRWINPAANGTALQRANTYTYKTPFYSMYTAQCHHAGEYADQQHVFGITLDNQVSLFHTHPASSPREKNPNRETPNFWVGHGRFPLSAQDGSVNLSIYILPAQKGYGESELLDYTHLYFPKEKFDEYALDRNRLFARYRGCYIAFLTLNDLSINENNQELVQEGKETFWICELSDSSRETFNEFMNRIRGNAHSFDRRILTYNSMNKKLTLDWKGIFLINDHKADTQYQRFESPYIVCKRMPEEMVFSFQNQSLYLHFDKMIREEKK